MPDPGISQATGLAQLERQSIAAWSQLTRNGREPTGVGRLQHEHARTVLRLEGAGPAGSSVIAKRCRSAVAAMEHSIYAEMLPALPLASLRVFGIVTEADGKHAWLFIEDALGERYDPGRADHRSLAGEWLGLMHTSAAGQVPPASLRERGLSAFAEDLREASAMLAEVRDNPALTSADLSLLAEILESCRLIAVNWEALEAFSDCMPRTLVHGDFKEDHIRIRADRTRPVPMLFDWHEAGWGAPLLDLAKFLGYSIRPDLSAYEAVVRRRWPGIRAPVIQRLGFVGEICRCVASTRWEVARLRTAWVERPIATLRIYSGWLREIVRAEPWAEEPTLGPQARSPRLRTWY